MKIQKRWHYDVVDYYYDEDGNEEEKSLSVAYQFYNVADGIVKGLRTLADYLKDKKHTIKVKTPWVDGSACGELQYKGFTIEELLDKVVHLHKQIISVAKVLEENLDGS